MLPLGYRASAPRAITEPSCDTVREELLAEFLIPPSGGQLLRQPQQPAFSRRRTGLTELARVSGVGLDLVEELRVHADDHAVGRLDVLEGELKRCTDLLLAGAEPSCSRKLRILV